MNFDNFFQHLYTRFKNEDVLLIFEIKTVIFDF